MHPGMIQATLSTASRINMFVFGGREAIRDLRSALQLRG